MRESITYVMDLVDKYTGPAEKIMASAGEMDTEFKSLNEELNKAGTIKADLNHFNSLNQKLNSNSARLKEAQKQTSILGQEIANTENPTKKQINSFEKSKRTVEKLKTTQHEYIGDISKLNHQLKSAGVNTNDMAIEQRKADIAIKRTTRSMDSRLKVIKQNAIAEAKLNDEMKLREKIDRYGELKKELKANHDLNRSKREQLKLEKEINDQQARVDAWDSRAQNMQVGAGDVIAAGGGVYAVNAIAQEYGEVASSQGELQSLGMSGEDIDAVTNKARSFSSQYAGFTQSELISSTYDLKSGISDLSGEALAGYLEISAKIAGGTKAEIDTITGLMATGYGIYRENFDSFGAEVIRGWNKLSQEEKDLKFGEYLGGGIASAVKMFKTDGQQMTDAIKSMGAVAETSGVSMAEQLTILGMMQKTMSGSEAATKYKSFVNNAYKASEKLGLSFIGADNKIKSTADVLDELKSRYGETLDDIEKAELKNAFGSDEAMAYITLMYTKTDELRGNIDKMADSMKDGHKTYTEMADAIMTGGPAESMQLLQQINKNMLADLGYGFAPVISKMASSLGNLSLKVGNFLRENKDMAEYIGIGVSSLIGLNVAVVASKFVFGGLFRVMAIANKGLLLWRSSTIAASISTWVMSKAAAAWNTISKVAAVGTALMSKGFAIFNAVLIANPIGLIIAGVAALGVAAYLLYKNWDRVSQFIEDSTRWLCDKLGINFDTVMGMFNSVKSGFSSMCDFMMDVGSALVDALSNVFSGLMDAIMIPIDAMKSAYNFGAEMGQAVGGWFDDDDEEEEKTLTQSKNVTVSHPKMSTGNTSVYGVNGQGGNKTISYNPTIHVSGTGLDSEEVGRVVMSKMEEDKRMMELKSRQRMHD